MKESKFGRTINQVSYEVVVYNPETQCVENATIDMYYPNEKSVVPPAYAHGKKVLESMELSRSSFRAEISFDDFIEVWLRNENPEIPVDIGEEEDWKYGV